MNREARTIRTLAGRTIASALLLLVTSGAAFAAAEIELNDTFDNRTVFDPGVVTADGSLDILIDPNDADFVFSATLNSGETNTHSIAGQTPGSSFFGAIDNTSGVDTLLGTFDESGTLLQTDDDSSPFGGGLADALNGIVNDDGSIRFGVTGCCDDTFTGNHDEAGDYELYVFFDTFFAADVDFLSFTGLTPGELVRARITAANFDPVLGLFSELGAQLAVDDDSAGNLLSQLTITVPVDGTINLAVSGFADFEFIGAHGQFGDYSVVIESVPLPAAWLLLAPAFALLVRLGRRQAS